MKPRNRRFLLPAILVVSIAVALTIAWRGASQVRSHDDGIARAIEDSERRIKSLNITPLASPDGLESYLVQAISQSLSSSGDKGDAEGIASCVNEFLRTRFVPGSGGIDIYVQARVDTNWVPTERAIYDSPGWAEFIEYSTGEPPNPEATSLEVIRALGRAEDSNHGSLATPTGIALEPGSVLAAVGTYSRANPMWPHPKGWVSEASMVSSGLVASKSHFTHAESLDPQLSQSGIAKAAQVQFVAEFGDGSRRPVILNLVWAPTLGEWIVENISVAAINIEDRDDHVRWVF